MISIKEKITGILDLGPIAGGEAKDRVREPSTNQQELDCYHDARNRTIPYRESIPRSRLSLARQTQPLAILLHCGPLVSAIQNRAMHVHIQVLKVMAQRGLPSAWYGAGKVA